jgi:hypothetical protein
MRIRALGAASGIALSLACAESPRPTAVDPHTDTLGTPLQVAEAPDWPNQPSGLTALTSRSFTSKARSGHDASGAEGWSVLEWMTGFSIREDASAPRSPARVAAFPLQAGWSGGTSVSRGAATYALSGGNFTTLYASLWVRVSPGWRGPRNGTNTFVHLSVGNADRVSLGVKGSGANALVPTVFLDNLAPETRRELGPNVAATAQLARGAWQRWEVLLTLNTKGAADGVVRWWIDGRSVAEYRDVQFIGHSDPERWLALQARLGWGSSWERVPASMSLTVDHAYLAAAEDRITGIDDPPPPPPPGERVVGSVTVAPPSVTVAPNDSVQLVATVRDTAGDAMADVPVTWRSTDPAIATTSSTGLVRGIAGGSASIIAVAASLADTAIVTVSAVPPPPTVVTRLDVSPATVSLSTGATQQFTATERLDDGSSRPAHGATWSATGGIVTASGLYTAGVSSGTFRVIAVGQTGYGDTATVVVTAPPPPPPPPGCTAPTILSHGFDNQQWAPLQNGGEGSYIAADATARGGYAVRKDWRGGSFDGGTVRALFTPQKRVYARWRFKYDARFDVNGIFKMIRFQDPNIGPLNGTMNIQWGRFVWFWDTQSVAYYQNVGAEISPQSLKDSWHWFEVMNDISIDGSPRARVWIDGVLKIDAVGSGTAPTNGKTFGSVQWTGTYNDPAATATSWVDDVALSINCIGVPQ